MSKCIKVIRMPNILNFCMVFVTSDRRAVFLGDHQTLLSITCLERSAQSCDSEHLVSCHFSSSLDWDVIIVRKFIRRSKIYKWSQHGGI